MWLLLVPACLAIFSSSFTSASEPHYVIAVPKHLKQGAEEKACVTFLDLKGPVDIKIELKHDDQAHNLAEHKVTSADHSECYSFQVPNIKDDHSDYFLHVSAHGEHINVDGKRKVTITKRNDVCVIQSDKSTYKPGDIVKFRILSVDPDFRPISKQHHVVEITDPKKNRIAQWLDVSTKQGFADLSFHLAHELALGDYRINIPDGCDKYFGVEQYEHKRFEFNLNAPSDIAVEEKSFHVEACGHYTYGKPVEGVIDLSVCSMECEDLCSYNAVEEADRRNCIDIKAGKLDDKGCVSRDFELAHFKTSGRREILHIRSKLTEDSTGHSEETSAFLHIRPSRKTVQFVGCEKFYHKGFPYNGKVKVSDEKNQPIVNEAVTLRIIQGEEMANVVRQNLVTDSHGIAHFTLKTSELPQMLILMARLSIHDNHEDLHEFSIWGFGESVPEDMLWLSRFYSNSESLLSIPEHPTEVSCNSDQSVTIEYDIHKKNLESDSDHLHFFYVIMSKNGIFSYKEHKVDIKDQADSPRLQGSFPLNIHVDDDLSPKFNLLVFTVLPNGETMARATEYKVSPCVRGKVKLSFSEEQVRPGEHVNLEVTAASGSLCSVRSVDKGYLLKNPHADTHLLTELTDSIRDDSFFSFFPSLMEHPDLHQCPENTTARYEEIFDVYRLFMTYDLEVFTNTEMKEPVRCEPHRFASRSAIKMKKDTKKDTPPKHLTRTYFPDSWLYELVPVGSEEHTVLNLTTPHTITNWVTDAFCLSPAGFASARDIELTTFQPYFIDLIVPSSVIQGEKFTAQAMVFSYVNKCILIAVSLSETEDLVTANDKDQSRCVCEGHLHKFSWDVSALKTKTLQIHVDSGFMEVEGECTHDAVVKGENIKKDTVEKTVVVTPKGYEDERAQTFLLLPSDNRDAITVNIKTPERLVAGSERAHMIIQGDLLSNVILNLNDIIPMPDGCGEQNTAKFTRYAHTLDYLQSVGELTPERKAKALEELTECYQTQLTFRTENGSFAPYPGYDDNLWLTALTVKALNAAQKFIYIDESHVQKAVNWLHSEQRPDGCFNEEGDNFNNELEADDLVPRTAYVTIALLEHHVAYNGSIVEDALSCLRKSVDGEISEYTRALLAYAFTLSGDTELRDKMLKKLEESELMKGTKFHYSSMEIETGAYVLLALLSEKTTTIKNLEDSLSVVRWLVKQQNPYGGFYSTQDTAIAVQALAKYAKAISHKKGDSTVTIKSKSGFEKTVHVDKTDSLLVQKIDLPEIPGEYTVTAIGDGFVYCQSHLYYHALPEEPEKGYFSFNVSSEPSTCTHASWKKFDVHMDVRYSGKREHTNMAMIVVKTVSGYVPEKESMRKLKKHPLVDRTEVSAHNISIYLTKLTHEPVSFVFTLEQETPVQNLQPGIAVVFDYYDPDEYTVVEYDAPCSQAIPHCEVSAGAREDCGFPNISKDQCHQKGCCFDPSVPGTKWCFFQDFKKTKK
ncbi:alpha-2-macroglobulin-like [Dendropsophus ebraccatus]|uniref:alpha-2-macroglobulin-like n=1 Tax=Dendropsophus ebraccatus TaxID=150705 RepID=UPI003831ACE8